MSSVENKKITTSSGGGYNPLHDVGLPKPQVQKETLKELAARQAEQRRAELTLTAEDYARCERNRERVLKERRQAVSSEINSHENCDCELSIDHDFIGKLEGSKKNGYVPMPEKSKSGVTIAVGFDLGARNIDDLRNLGLSNDLIERFTPYLGLKKIEAKSFLESHPLSINDQELETIVKLVKESETEKIVVNYNKYSSVKFECLPKQAQTVIASVAYQYGSHGVIVDTPNFWKQATHQDWEGMFANLMDFYDKTPTRRETEAKLIKELIN
ncbi:pesticin C-terminus-like muramidase [Vibrio caribbeanicus]|uniref:pesticin C-terminus-like muramidase n=1 Tax=Vibrio caribbeanicus TaxID=701175 RepID=UPI0022836E64|nr:pesticin C-terminus-like muramidase [Vibrio caribbeanicus]MCY9845923.1 pesticin C-terminus-like muramidase [Vibrio caribbeanicus]